MAVNDTTVLQCGRDLGRVWDHLDRPPDGHERDCPYCQGARSGARGVRDVTLELIADDRSNPGMRVGPAVKHAILDVARTELRRSRTLPLERPQVEQTVPSLTISELTVAEVARTSADRLPGVRIRRCHALHTAQQPSSEEGQPAEVRLRIDVATSAAVHLPTLLTRLRSQVRLDLAEEIGLDVVAIDITVEDIYDA